MKTWNTGQPNPRGDLYADETPIPRVGICDQFRAMAYVFKALPHDEAKVVLERLFQ